MNTLTEAPAAARTFAGSISQKFENFQENETYRKGKDVYDIVFPALLEYSSISTRLIELKAITESMLLAKALYSSEQTSPLFQQAFSTICFVAGAIFAHPIALASHALINIYNEAKIAFSTDQASKNRARFINVFSQFLFLGMITTSSPLVTSAWLATRLSIEVYHAVSTLNKKEAHKAIAHFAVAFLRYNQFTDSLPGAIEERHRLNEISNQKKFERWRDLSSESTIERCGLCKGKTAQEFIRHFNLKVPEEVLSQLTETTTVVEFHHIAMTYKERQIL